MEKIALFEYDECQNAVINPDHEDFDYKFPPVAVFAFVGDLVDDYAAAHDAKIIGEFESTTKIYPIYSVPFNGMEICLCQAPCGAAPAAQIMDWLIGYGVKTIISTGCCGVLTDISENAFLVPTRALRDEGTSFHYLPPTRYVDLDREMIRLIKEYFAEKNIPCEECTTWTTDGFYRETKQKVKARREEGCTTVEMECSALAACAAFRGAKFGQFLFTADSLHAVEEYDTRGWGKDAQEPALEMAMEIAGRVGK